MARERAGRQRSGGPHIAASSVRPRPGRAFCRPQPPRSSPTIQPRCWWGSHLSRKRALFYLNPRGAGEGLRRAASSGCRSRTWRVDDRRRGVVDLKRGVCVFSEAALSPAAASPTSPAEHAPVSTEPTVHAEPRRAPMLQGSTHPAGLGLLGVIYIFFPAIAFAKKMLIVFQLVFFSFFSYFLLGGDTDTVLKSR